MRAISLKDLLNDTVFIGHEPPSLNKNLSAFFRYRQRWSQIVTGSTSEIRVAKVWTVGLSEKENWWQIGTSRSSWNILEIDYIGIII